MEGHNGQTIGKMITRIRVVREEDGGKIDMERSFKRNILRIIDGLIAYLVGAVLIWRSDKKQRLGVHDEIVRLSKELDRLISPVYDQKIYSIKINRSILFSGQGSYPHKTRLLS
jgi:hypothetical protein